MEKVDGECIMDTCISITNWPTNIVTFDVGIVGALTYCAMT
jgi:hypothetical protein